MKKIIILGDLFLDILPTTFPIKKDFILYDGETFVENVTFQRGGCAGNFAAVLSNLLPNNEIIFISKAGNDLNSEFLLNQLKSYGLKCFISKSNLGTPITIAISYTDGQRHFITYNGAMDDFSIEDLDYNLFENTEHLAWRGIWFTPKLLQNAEKFLSYAKSNNITTSMDLGFDPYWASSDISKETIEKRKKYALNALKFIDYLFGNEQEVLNLTSETNLNKSIDKLLNFKVKNIIIHLGEKGAMIIQSNNEEIIIPPIKPSKIINPVGTGDTFDAAFISQILDNKDLKFAGKFAAAAASYSLENKAGTKVTVNKINEIILKSN